MEPPQEAEIDFSEVFANDKMAFNARNLNYWCAGHASQLPACAADPASLRAAESSLRSSAAAPAASSA